MGFVDLLLTGVIAGAVVWQALLTRRLVKASQDQSQAAEIQSRFATLARKRDVLYRIVGHRHLLTPMGISGGYSSDQLDSALNEACVVFAQDSQVISELQRMLTLRDQTEGLLPLIRAMAKAVEVPINVDDEFLIKPFARNVNLVK